ncbi:M16 family metallopeptidase [Mongoliimonas terrestris]|uniref:M16 family metallopeptidase n=1 Tax=Mongoliimonas terrestris TaxID=1709001 RepID=UPI00094986D0|nr:pitrilysin family protein [Mongoliimonas terrestris]
MAIATAHRPEHGPDRRRSLAVALALAVCLAPIPPALAQTAPSTVSETAPSPVETTPAPVIGADVSTFTLDNGLDVVVIPDRRAPVVTHMIWYKVGSADEPPGKSGIAHFLEHLMFKGTSTHPEGEFSRVVTELGGQENAFTSYDYTAYYQRVAKEHLGRMMGFEADRMQNLVLTDENVAPERQVVLEERAMRIDSEPGAILGTGLDAVLYLQHPYGIPIIGYVDEIAALDRTDAIAFYDRFYTPNNAILVVAGDVTTEEVRRLAEETYGKVPRRAEPPVRERPFAPILETPREVSHADPKVQQESVQITWLVDSYRLAEPGEAEALDVLAEAIGGGSTSLLFRDLVIDRKLATGAGAAYQSGFRDQAQFTLYAAPREGVSLETMRTELMDAFATILKERLTDEEIDRAKARLEADTVYAQDSQQALARIFGSTLAIGGTVAEVQTWPAAIRALTRADIEAAAAAFDPKAAVVGYLRNAPPEERS